jgi:hypothetical protein
MELKVKNVSFVGDLIDEFDDFVDSGNIFINSINWEENS